jgi:hypothetical protein
MRLVAGVEERFLVPCNASPRREAWISAYGALALPLLARGRERVGIAQCGGEQVRVTAIGRPQRIRELLAGWFDDPLPPLEDGSTRCLWRPTECMRSPAELRVAEIHGWAAQRFRQAAWRIIPDSVRWVGELGSIPPRHASRSLSSDLVNVSRGDFALAATHEPADWQTFYHDMVRPAAISRFGEHAWIPSPATMRSFARAGTLLMLTSEGERVAGICVIPAGESLWAPLLAVPEQASGEPRKGVGAALYKLTFDWARSHGFRQMNMGRTSSRLDDPIAWYKRKWGLRPVPEPLAHRLAVWADPNCAALWRALARRPVLTEEPNGLVAFPGAA